MPLERLRCLVALAALVPSGVILLLVLVGMGFAALNIGVAPYRWLRKRDVSKVVAVPAGIVGVWLMFALFGSVILAAVRAVVWVCG